MSKKFKTIGRYLLDSQACDQEAVSEALNKQSSLEKLGEYKSVGEIMVENGSVALEDLENVLKQQWFDLLSGAELFQSLSDEQINQLVNLAEDRTINKNTILFSQGDPGETYWLVISGQVRVYRYTHEDNEVELSRLQAGDGFGEMSLLTGEPRSASVETVLASRFLVIHKNDFDQVVNNSPEMTVTFAKILADRLTRGNISLEKASTKERAYQRFVSDYQAGPQFELIGKSPQIEKVRQQSIEFSNTNKPVLIIGPPGTEKKSVSWHMHKEGSSQENPFLYVDIKNIKHISQSDSISTSDHLQKELAQDSILFGHQQGALSFAKTNRLGLLQVGNTGTVVIDNIELLVPSMQAKLADFIRTGIFQPLGQGEKVYSTVRITCCTSDDLKTLTEKDLFSDELYSLISEQALKVVPLKRRKKDLNLLVDYLVDYYSQQLGKAITGVDQKAYGEIMSYDWPGNMEELEIVIRRAVNLTSYKKLAPENLFIGATPSIDKFSFNLLQLPKVKKLFGSAWYPEAVQLVTGAFFLYIFYLGFWGSQNPSHNLSLVLTWGIWEPVGVISSIIVARLWCGICPIGAASSVCSQHFSLKLSVPHFLRKYGFYLSGIGFAIIIWSEVVTHMVTSPRATALLITAIAVPAIIFGLLFQRRSWCRYICPLGKIIGVFASASMLELRANYGICNNDCLTHRCYTGDEKSKNACPMFEGPFSLRSNLNCTLCGNCIKNCPNQAPRLNLRLPGYELWSSSRFEKTVAFLVPLIIGTQFFRGLEAAGYLNVFLNNPTSRSFILFILIATVTVLILGAFKIAEDLMSKYVPSRNSSPAGMLSYGMLFLAVTFEMAFHLERFLLLSGQVLPVLGRQLGLHWDKFGTSGAPWAITTLQVILILLGSLGSSVVLRRIYLAFADDDSPEKTPLSWRMPVILTAFAYVWLFIAG